MNRHTWTQRMRSERGEPGVIATLFFVILAIGVAVSAKYWIDYTHALELAQSRTNAAAVAVASETLEVADPVSGERYRVIDMSGADTRAKQYWAEARLSIRDDDFFHATTVRNAFSGSVATECIEAGPVAGTCAGVRVEISDTFTGSVFRLPWLPYPSFTREGFARLSLND